MNPPEEQVSTPLTSSPVAIVVDDSRSTRSDVRTLLERMGYSVEEYEDRSTALARFTDKSKPPLALIVTDNDMIDDVTYLFKNEGIGLIQDIRAQESLAKHANPDIQPIAIMFISGEAANGMIKYADFAKSKDAVFLQKGTFSYSLLETSIRRANQMVGRQPPKKHVETERY